MPLLRTLALLRETKAHERRAPLSPNAIAQLVKMNIKVIVQPSRTRIYTDKQYREAGAKIQENIKDAKWRVAVKELKPEEYESGKTYCLFSHTHKGQKANRPALKAVLDKKVTLIDYELITEKGKRKVLFGKFAGYAGTIDIIHGLGKRLLALGYATPLIHSSPSHAYRDLDTALQVIRQLALEIADKGTNYPQPLVIGLTGGGAVSAGAKTVLDALNVTWINPSELPLKRYSTTTVYATQFDTSDIYTHKADGKFDEKDYFEKGKECYDSVFAFRYADHLTCLINGIYWEPKYPRLLSKGEGQKLVAIADITCDIEGSIEYTTHASTIDNPFYYYDTVNDTEHSNPYGPGVMMLTIDNLPAELPFDASEYFSSSLLPYISSLVSEGSSEALMRATIASDGKLMKPYEHLLPLLQKSEPSILILGAGMVAAPCRDYLKKRYKVVSGGLEGEADIEVDASSYDNLKQVIHTGQYDLVISLVPAFLHTNVAKACIANKIPLVTASYILPEMQVLDAEAKAAGIPILNELGLDPGIDHLTAMQIIDEVTGSGGWITSFESWCGGLPAPEDSSDTGGLGYKFSWSPRSVLSAIGNEAKWIEDGQMKTIQKGRLLEEGVRPLSLFEGFRTEGYPNRDSTKYVERYGLDPVKLKTMIRGTIRYEGWCKRMEILNKLDLLSTEVMDDIEGKSWDDLIDHNKRKKYISEDKAMLDFLFPSHSSSPAHPGGRIPKTKVDSLSGLLASKLRFGPGERDLVILQHTFGAEWPNGRKEIIKSGVVAYGEPLGAKIGERDPYTAMGKTVGLPAAIGADVLLQGRSDPTSAIGRLSGVLAPMSKILYEPILEGLRKEKVIPKESRITVEKGSKD